MFTCTMIAPGIAYGPAVIWVTAGEFFRRQQISPLSVPAEIQRFDLARRRARRELDEIASRAEAAIGSSAAAIFTAHGQLLDDPKFFEPVVRRINDQHMAAELAVHATVEEFAGRFASLGNGCLAARAIRGRYSDLAVAVSPDTRLRPAPRLRCLLTRSNPEDCR